MKGGGSDLNCPAHTAGKRSSSATEGILATTAQNATSLDYASMPILRYVAELLKLAGSPILATLLRGLQNPSADSTTIRVAVSDNDSDAVMDDIAELKGCTDTLEQTRDSLVPETATEGNYGLTLFFGLSPSINRSDLLVSLPSRPGVDRLVSRYFNTKEPTLMILHIPTFYREYTQFWEDQHAAPVAWIGLLFNILCYSVSFYQRAGDALPGSLAGPRRARDKFRTHAAQCLALVDYTRPGRYKVEALLLYSGIEFMRIRDS
ncbi:hypothetical protein THAR02_06630 [Trichoderma harzianum]|uniref:Transcription factor domain-containing protein n=1 Tax=Trichoderma harzianum TaxID=5544 RepID=A0A0F9ZLZ3_TRIHA|nr:hypothetical protein THAR02_06630 [Trichoderma harzianum]